MLHAKNGYFLFLEEYGEPHISHIFAFEDAEWRDDGIGVKGCNPCAEHVDEISSRIAQAMKCFFVIAIKAGDGSVRENASMTGYYSFTLASFNFVDAVFGIGRRIYKIVCFRNRKNRPPARQSSKSRGVRLPA